MSLPAPRTTTCLLPSGVGAERNASTALSTAATLACVPLRISGSVVVPPPRPPAPRRPEDPADMGQAKSSSRYPARTAESLARAASSAVEITARSSAPDIARSRSARSLRRTRMRRLCFFLLRSGRGD